MRQFAIDIPGQYGVAVKRIRHNKYEVRYGMQVKTDLTYTEASKELGDCVMHALQCAGFHDQRPHDWNDNVRVAISDRVDAD